MTEEQYRKLVVDYHQPLLSVVHKMVHRWEAARDLTQDVFLRLWKKHRAVRFTDNIYTLLYRMTMNQCIDYLRKGKERLLPQENQIEANKERKIEENELLEIIKVCISRLSPKQKAVIILRDMEGFEIKEIAGILKSSQGNINSNLYLARQNMRAMLRDEYQINEDYLYEL